MTKAGVNDWKTPLWYYERAIAEIRKAREEFQAELKNLKEIQTSPDELQKLETELKKLQEELQTTNKCLETTQKTASEFQDRVVNAEKVANDSQTELQNLKAETQNYRTESQNLKEELQTTNKYFETTWKTAKEFQDRAAKAEKSANDSRRELQILKANLRPLRLESVYFQEM